MNELKLPSLNAKHRGAYKGNAGNYRKAIDKKGRRASVIEWFKTYVKQKELNTNKDRYFLGEITDIAYLKQMKHDGYLNPDDPLDRQAFASVRCAKTGLNIQLKNLNNVKPQERFEVYLDSVESYNPLPKSNQLLNQIDKVNDNMTLGEVKAMILKEQQKAKEYVLKQLDF